VDAVVAEDRTASQGRPSTLDEALAVIAELTGTITDLNRKNAALEHRVHLLCQRIFGRRSEKDRIDASVQPLLPYFEAAAAVVAADASDEDVSGTSEETVVVRKKKAHRGRRPLPQDLPCEEVVLEPAAEEKICAGCACEKVKIGEDRTMTLDYRPASFFRREYIRPKLVCPQCQQGVAQAELPMRPIEKGRPEPGVLAHVVTSKYSDHLPLYRQEQIFHRHGVEVSRRTLAEWCGATADLLRLVVEEGIHKELLLSPYQQVDDTTLDVQLPEERGKEAKERPAIKQGNMWAYRGAGGEVVYDFTWGRIRESPERMLREYHGYVQADAAAAYDSLFLDRPDLIEVGCMAHCRRKFKEAAPTSAERCAMVTAKIRELYRIEQGIRGQPAEKRLGARQTFARPVMGQLFDLIVRIAGEVLPKSPLGEACRYALKNRAALERYLEDGRLEIDNNGAERAMKPVVLGRRNWMFCGSEAAAKRAAILLSLVNTCKNLGMDPFVYLRDVIDRISTYPRSRVHELTPRQWLKARLAAAPAAQAA
jgi:transposase